MEELLYLSYHLAHRAGQDPVTAAKLLREYFYCEHEAGPGECCDASLQAFEELITTADALGSGVQLASPNVFHY